MLVGGLHAEFGIEESGNRVHQTIRDEDYGGGDNDPAWIDQLDPAPPDE